MADRACLSVCVQVAAEGKEGERERERDWDRDGNDVCVYGDGGFIPRGVEGTRAGRGGKLGDAQGGR